MKLHQFYKQFEDIKREDRFESIKTPIEPSSLFVIFKQLEQVRAQQRYFVDREKQLLALAELGFEQLRNKQDGVQ